MHCWRDDTHDLRTLADLRALYPEPLRPAAAATLDKCDYVPALPALHRGRALVRAGHAQRRAAARSISRRAAMAGASA
ncbi:MAG: hypothetical protein U1E77_14800 [Inhella sp.]